VTGGESTLAGNEEVMNSLKETPRKWMERLPSSSFERDMFIHYVSGLYPVG
jgi:hypothetical protein